MADGERSATPFEGCRRKQVAVDVDRGLGATCEEQLFLEVLREAYM